MKTEILTRASFTTSLRVVVIVLLNAVATKSAASEAGPPSFSNQQLAFFESKIRPLLIEHCHECHGADRQEAGLRLDSRTAALTGGDSGPAIEVGDPDSSLLIDAVRYGDAYQMPPTKRLPDPVVAQLEEWVRNGAAWTPNDQQTTASTKPPFDLPARKASHWAWHPINPSPPPLRAGLDTVTPIDAFIFEKLDAEKLSPSAPTDRHSLLRRVTFDLTGLPPSAEEVQAFEADNSDDAFAQVVERMLASPSFGERWARHWLDVVRYAETLGHESDFPLTNAWLYRDYVIRALNDDVPYNQFVREHIAGDLLGQPRRRTADGVNESILATAFWYLGEANHAPVDSLADQATRIENQVDVLSKAFLGLTVACARCHDHKFDAISTKDYYALAGYAASSHQQVAYLDPNGQLEAGAAKLIELHREVSDLLNFARSETWAGVTPHSAQSTITSLSSEENTTLTTLAGNADDSVLFEGFANGFDRWYQSGWAFGASPTTASDWRLGSHGPEFVTSGIAHSGRFGDRLPGVLRSATFTIDKNYIHYFVAGRKAKVRLVVDGYALDQFTPLLFEGFTISMDNESMEWRSQNVARYLGHRAHIEFIDAGEGYIAVDEIHFTKSAEPPITPSTSSQSVAAVCKSSANDLHNSYRLEEILQEIAKIDAALPDPLQALAIGDGSGEDLPVHIRGNCKTLGEVAPRRMLEAIAGDESSTSNRDCGRLQLADSILSDRNPFIARVMVNRIWRHLFGRGLVATVDNFGVLGEPPTHPELLDYLAGRFVELNWSVKSLIREIVLTDAYQRSSQMQLAAEAIDPQNLLMRRANVRRLEGESIRDSLLAISGRLDRTMFGPSVPVHLTTFMDGRGKPALSGPLDGMGRRSIYLEVRRNFLSPFLLAFDMPVPASCVGQRNSSNVPAQALALLNDPFVIDQCDAWARRVLTKDLSDAQRIKSLYLVAFGRPPTEDEVTLAADFIAKSVRREAGSSNNQQAWANLCHVLVNVKEFIYLR